MPVDTLAQPTARRGRPKIEDLAAREEHLIMVASQLFYRHGYGATTMSAVAHAASVSKTTLYARFPSKSALFRAVVGRQIESWSRGRHHTPVDRTGSLRDMLTVYASTVLRAGLAPDFIQLQRLTIAESGRFPELAQQADSRTKLGIQDLAGELDFFARRDGIACKDAARVAEQFLLMMTGWCTAVMVANRKVTAAERTDWLESAVSLFIASRAAW